MSVNLATFDLRLLVVLDALMAERNVTRAARNLGMSQPAMSNALNRLRVLANDPLFVRSAAGMRPTAKALSLAEPVRQGLRQIQHALQPPVFIPAETSWSFNIAISSPATMVMLPHLIERTTRSAPHINLRLQPKLDSKVSELLDSGQVDFAIGILPKLGNRFSRKNLYDDSYVAVMRRDHPLARRRIDLEEFASADHLAISPTLEGTSGIDTLLRRHGLQRRIIMNVNQYLAAPAIVARTNLVATMLERVTRVIDMTGLVARAVPLPSPSLAVDAVWNRASSGAAAHKWLLQQMTLACENLG